MKNNEIEQADVMIVNTCGFIEQAKQEAIDTILEDYRNVWTKYRAEYQKNYSLYCSYKHKLPREKVYEYLIQLPTTDMSSTARQVLQMNSAYYPIEALRVALDMIEE